MSEVEPNSKISQEQLQEVRDFAIREGPGAARRSFAQMSIGVAQAVIDRRDLWQGSGIHYEKIDSAIIVREAYANSQANAQATETQNRKNHEHTALVWMKLDGGEEYQEVTFRPHNTEIKLRDDPAATRVQYTFTSHVSQRYRYQDSAARYTATKSATCHLKDADLEKLMALKEAGVLPYSYEPDYIDPYEKSVEFRSKDGSFIRVNRNTTTVHLFEDPRYNHIEITYDDGTSMRLFEAAPKAETNRLVNLRFPRTFTPGRINSAVNWLYERAKRETALEARQQADKIRQKAAEAATASTLEALEALYGLQAAEGDSPAAPEEIALDQVSLAEELEVIAFKTDESELAERLESLAWIALAEALYASAGQEEDTRDEVSEELFNGLASNCPSLARARYEFATELFQKAQVADDEEEAHIRAKNMTTGFDAYVLALSKIEEISKPLKELDNRALADYTSAGVKITASAEVEGDPELLQQEIQILRKDFKVLGELRKQLVLATEAMVLSKAQNEGEEVEKFEELNSGWRDISRQILFGATIAAFATRELVKQQIEDN